MPNFSEARGMRLLGIQAIVLVALGCFGGETMLFIGDSITSGDHVASADRFVERFRALGYQPVNAGLGGDYTDNAKNRLPSLLTAHKPGIVVIMFGTNDSGPINSNGDPACPVDRYTSNLLYMISLCKANRAKVYLCTSIPGRYEVAWRTARMQPYVDAVREICRLKKKVTLIDNYAAWAEKNVTTLPYQLNGTVVDPSLLFVNQMIPSTEAGGVNYFHPSAAGHAFIFETMKKVINP
jgi:lysophospholipase L1-like esterase